jgi:hypothetical protein
MVNILLGDIPTFRKVCRVPLGVLTAAPVLAEIVLPPTMNSSSPSST